MATDSGTGEWVAEGRGARGRRARRVRAAVRLVRMGLKRTARRMMGGAVWAAGLCWWTTYGIAYTSYAVFFAGGALFVSTLVALWCVLWSGE
jgi:hypothetical protein